MYYVSDKKYCLVFPTVLRIFDESISIEKIQRTDRYNYIIVTDLLYVPLGSKRGVRLERRDDVNSTVSETVLKVARAKQKFVLIPASRSGRNTESANIEIVNNTSNLSFRALLKFRIRSKSDERPILRTRYHEQKQLYRNPFISFPRFAYLVSIAKLIADTDSTDDRDENFRNERKLPGLSIVEKYYTIVNPAKLETLLSEKEREREYIEIIETSFEISHLYRLSKLLINLIFTRRNIYIYNPILENEIGNGQSCSFRDNDR